MKFAKLYLSVFLVASFCCGFGFAQESVSKEYLIGKFNPGKDNRFAQKGRFFLRKETLQALTQMQVEAAKSRIRLSIVSATRTFSDQKRIWESKWNGVSPVNTDTNEFLPKPYNPNSFLSDETRAMRILEFTAMPTSSRHHWGTDIDLNNVNSSYWVTMRGELEYRWLSENASRFGFCQVYSAERNSGYKEEKWHWSYLPVARGLTDEYKKQITNFDLSTINFIGSATAAKLNIVDQYVLGINPDCK